MSISFRVLLESKIIPARWFIGTLNSQRLTVDQNLEDIKVSKRPKAQDCANLAMDEADGDIIPYAIGKETLGGEGADCQGILEAVIRAWGGEMSYRGSNDMFRNACSYVDTLNQAKKEGRLVPGTVLFIVLNDGGEPPQYRDGKGNASHAINSRGDT